MTKWKIFYNKSFSRKILIIFAWLAHIKKWVRKLISAIWNIKLARMNDPFWSTSSRCLISMPRLIVVSHNFMCWIDVSPIHKNNYFSKISVYLSNPFFIRWMKYPPFLFLLENGFHFSSYEVVFLSFKLGLSDWLISFSFALVYFPTPKLVNGRKVVFL